MNKFKPSLNSQRRSQEVFSVQLHHQLKVSLNQSLSSRINKSKRLGHAVLVATIKWMNVMTMTNMIVFNR